MARVLILGLYYPPANFIAGRRLEGWARHLPAFGYESLVLTRYYDPEERNRHDFYASSRAPRTLAEPWVEENDVVYTNFKPGLWSRLPVPGKVRGIVHFGWPDPDHSVWFRQCFDYLKNSRFKPDIIIGSSGPPGVFRIARRLSERLGIPWVADFRDLWVDKFDRSFDTRLKYFFQRRHLQSAAGITVVADAMVDAVRGQLAPLEKPVRLIYSGAEPAANAQAEASDSQAVALFQRVRSSNKILLTYAGTLYPDQEIERFLDAVAEFNRLASQTCAVVLCGRHEREDFVKWPFVEIIEPVSHSTALFFQKQSTALFYPTWPQRYSGFSGKIFELVISGRPVLVCFSPSPDLEALCKNFKAVSLIKEPQALVEILRRLPEMERDAEINEVPVIATKKYWAGELAQFLDEVLRRQSKAGSVIC